jgi:aspartate racemase
MHLGLIGGIGPAATEFYYRGLVRAHAAAHRTLDLTIVHAEANDLVRNMTDNTPQRQAEIFLRFARRLEGAGADAVAITSMTGHFCVREFEALSPLPVISAIPAIAAELDRRKLRRVGLIGTRVVMQSRLYGALDGVEAILPEGPAFQAMHDAYVAMALSGQPTAAQRDVFFSVGRELCRRGAEAVLLGGTDLFIAFEGHECGFPAIDSAQVHVDELARRSIEGSGG